MPRDMRWKQLMHILGEINGAYHDASVKMGLADSEMQILYSVHMAEGKLYPSEIARLCGMSRQTVGSALRALEIGADALLCGKKCDGVYNKNPDLYPDAVRYDRLTYDEVIAIGDKAEKIADGAAQSGGSVTHFATKEEAVRTLTDLLGADTAMLVKASHAMHFGWIVEQLKQAYD